MATSINVKMYKVGELGDCFLLTIKNEKAVKYMLIDCGSFRNSQKSIDLLSEIAKDIKKQTKNKPLNVVLGTHQHNDHVSGFVHAKSIFEQIGIEQVWLSWLDNPKDTQAVTIGESHKGLRKSIHAASLKMGNIIQKQAAQRPKSHLKMAETKSIIDGLLDFFGAVPEIPSQGIENLKKIGKNDPAYLVPGTVLPIRGISQDVLKVYVLGPPKDEDLLYKITPKKGESYDPIRAMSNMAASFLSSLNHQDLTADKEEEQYPFNNNYKILQKSGGQNATMLPTEKIYKESKNDWRNINDDWLEQATRMALFMDTYTNNSSLAIAIELVKSNKVLLFPADAQTGNWLSWSKLKFKSKTTSSDALLANTVFYKVGHHGSHNATLVDSLEKMTHDELVAMIPVDKTDANITKEKNPWKMPAKNLFKRLKEKTQNRVLRMDEGFASDCDPSKSQVAKASWKKLKNKPVVDKNNLYVEYEIS